VPVVGSSDGAPAERRAYEALQCYTLGHGGAEFIHQHVVDAWAAQHAARSDKPIRLAFALIGLYLHLERGLTGREVQQAHMRLAHRRQPWPTFPLPSGRGSMAATEVMAAPPGEERDRAIDAWCASVWAAYQGSRQAVVDLLDRHGIR
jgi:hypothetical protein